MINSLRVIGTYIIFLHGFYSVSATAASINNVDTDFNSILNNNVAVYLDVDGYYGATTPSDTAAIIEDTQDTSEISSFGLPKFQENVMTDANIDSDTKISEHGAVNHIHINDDYRNVSVPGTADDIDNEGRTSSFGLPKFDESITTGTDNDFDSSLSNYEKPDTDVNDYQTSAASAAADDTERMTGVSIFGQPEFVENVTNLELFDTENTIPDASSPANSNRLEFDEETAPHSTKFASLAEKTAADSGNEFAENASIDENNSLVVPELNIYAMLLVFLGLMCFTARRRRDIV